MKVLDKYIIRQTVVTLLMTVGVYTFVLMLGWMMRKLSEMLVNRQVGLEVVGWVVVLMLPYILSFTLPMAMLAAVLLVFGRLSADNEVTALRASGVGLWQMAGPVIVGAALLAGVCLYINGYLAPRCGFQFKTMFVQMGVQQPMALLEEGRLIEDFPGYRLYVGKKRMKQNAIEDVIIQVLDSQGVQISRLEARRGVVSADPVRLTLLLDLYDVRGDLRDPDDPTNVRKIRAGTTAQRYPIELDLGRVLRRARTAKRLGDFTWPELREEIARLRGEGIYPGAALLEGHQRVASAVACVAFTLIGIPLGLKTSRRETTLGIALSLGLAFLYYFVTVTAWVFKDQPQYYPEALLWLPNLIFAVMGVWLMWRTSRV